MQKMAAHGLVIVTELLGNINGLYSNLYATELRKHESGGMEGWKGRGTKGRRDRVGEGGGGNRGNRRMEG